MAKDRQRDQRWLKSDFYGVLSLRPSASQEEVKKGFRRVALTCHPDKVAPEAREVATRRFQLIVEAYEVLSSPALRREYDALRPGGGQGSAGQGSKFTPPARTPPAQTPPGRTPPPARAPAGERPSPRKPPQPQAQAQGNGDAAAGGAARPRQQQTGAASARESPQSSRGGPGGSGAAHAQTRAAASDRQGGPGQPSPRCDGCDARTLAYELSKCPTCSRRICRRCDICAACIPENIAPRQPRRFARRGFGHDPEEATYFADRGMPSPPKPSGPPREVWTRAPSVPQRRSPSSSSKGSDCTEEQESEMPSDEDEVGRLLSVLLMMGFREKDARSALESTSSLSGAVEHIMNSSAGGLQRAATGLYDAAGSLGEHLQPAASGLYDNAIQPAAHGLLGAASGLVEVVGRLGSHVHELVVANASNGAEVPSAEDRRSEVWVNERLSGRSREDPPSTVSVVDRQAEIRETLTAIGFPKAEVEAAVRRCSSVEAAVEWISQNPPKRHP